MFFQVVDWILGPAEKLMISQTDIGDTYSKAEELRKQHEQLELKCTVCQSIESTKLPKRLFWLI